MGSGNEANLIDGHTSMLAAISLHCIGREVGGYVPWVHDSDRHTPWAQLSSQGVKVSLQGMLRS